MDPPNLGIVLMQRKWEMHGACDNWSDVHKSTGYCRHMPYKVASLIWSVLALSKSCLNLVRLSCLKLLSANSLRKQYNEVGLVFFF